MKHKLLVRIGVLGFFLVCVLLSLSNPRSMLAPGKLRPEHQKIETQCLSCHQLTQGIPIENCTTCHSVEKIGLFSSKGIKLNPEEHLPFHQKLVENDCHQCHLEHKGSSVYRNPQNFSHKLLKPSIREDCVTCHHKPKDNLHQELKISCIQCHKTSQWKPATFEHKLLKPSIREDCVTCHRKPKDNLHQELKTSCSQCHKTSQWKPATFEHEQYFRFDKHHSSQCNQCHLIQDFTQYTCYECHEHSSAKIKEEHLEEGIHNFENCTECHRSGNEDEAKRLWRLKSGGKNKNDEHHSKKKREDENNDD